MILMGHAMSFALFDDDRRYRSFSVSWFRVVSVVDCFLQVVVIAMMYGVMLV